MPASTSRLSSRWSGVSATMFEVSTSTESPPSSALVVFTSRYPFSGSEMFIGHELPYLEGSFRVLFAPKSRSDSTQTAVRRTVAPDRLSLSGVFKTLRAWVKLMRLLPEDVFAAASRPARQGRLLPVLWQILRRFASAALLVSAAVRIESTQLGESERVLYAYWGDAWALALSAINARFVLRVGGYDIYPEQNRGAWVPSQIALMRLCSAVIAPSEAAAHFLAGHYPSATEKIFALPRGVPRQRTRNPIPIDGDLRIVSLSGINPGKRLELVAGAVAHIAESTNVRVKWVHLGGGAPADEAIVFDYIRVLGISELVEMRGAVPFGPEGVFEILRKEPFSVGVNTSVSEGLPTALTEFLSFGIPIVATDIDGNREVVQKSSGFLVPADCSAEQLAVALLRFSDVGSLIDTLRSAAVTCQKEHYCVQKNSKARIELLRAHAIHRSHRG